MIESLETTTTVKPCPILNLKHIRSKSEKLGKIDFTSHGGMLMEQTVRILGQHLNVFAGTDTKSTILTILRLVKSTAKHMAKPANAKCLIISQSVSSFFNFDFF